MEFKIQNSKFKIRKKRGEINDLIHILLENRGIKTKKEIEEFLNPKLEDVNAKNVGLDIKQLKKAVTRIKLAIENKEEIIIFGDYDVDGICATAILWETLYGLGAKVMPYIPHRIDEGYGISLRSISNIIHSTDSTSSPQSSSVQKSKTKDTKLIITVDNGIVANEAVEFADKQGIDVIITDHHVPSSKLPNAYSIVHTTKLCGAGVAYLLAWELITSNNFDHLSLAALATVADLVPLTGANRTLLKFGLERLRKTKRAGLLELFKEAGIEKEKVGVYEIGHIIAPRLNAMGRLQYAMDSLRLLCTNNKTRAEKLARLLGETNRQRQALTIESVKHAINSIKKSKVKSQNLLFVADESYQQGIVGLVAGRLVEEFYMPSIVVSKGEKISRASARSVKGFNIIEFIRMSSEFLIDAGGHPMAAGFTFETEKLAILQKSLEETAEKLLNQKKPVRTLRIDCEIPLSIISDDLYKSLQMLSPFGMGNPEPTFISKDVTIDGIRVIGRDGGHLKLKIKNQNAKRKNIIKDSEFTSVDAIGFGMGERVNKFAIGDKVDIVYSIDRNTWNGNSKLQLKIKDIKKEN